MLDTIIVGGGPAGLSAALVLGRCRRRGAIYDVGHPRNERSRAMHGFLSRDGTPPAEFGKICRDQLRTYPDVELHEVEVVSARHEAGTFTVEMRNGTKEQARTLLLATGITDKLPEISGFSQFYGRSVHHCPYCDGWEHRDQALAVLGGGIQAIELAAELLLWSKDIVLCTNGATEATSAKQAKLERLGIRVITQRVARLEGDGDNLKAIHFDDGSSLPRSALFFSPAQYQRSPLAEQLGCEFCEECNIKCGDDTQTSIPGLFAAGNASPGLQLVIMAAAEGTRAAFAINETLSRADGLIE